MEEEKKSLHEPTIATEKYSHSSTERAKSVKKREKDFSCRKVMIKGTNFKICSSTPEKKVREKSTLEHY